jgi:pSer/pThr/pTyr-binding forkhead associated (FHA) protein
LRSVRALVELRSTTTVGRDSANDIMQDELTVSRCQAVLFVQPEDIILRELGSTNGTWVNGVPVARDAPLCLFDGDVIWLGQLVVRSVGAFAHRT